MSSLHITRIARQRRRRRRGQGLRAPQALRWIGVIVLCLLILAVLTAAAGAGGLAVIYGRYASQLPPAADIIAAEEEAFLTTVLYDRTGQTVIYEVMDPTGGDRRWVSVRDIPQYFLDATVAIEDASFYENPGFDMRGMGRALWNNLTGGHIQGGSTITQQLVRNVLFTEGERLEISLDRKAKEVILATEISRLYSKHQILEWYINTNFYGGWAYGVEAAAQQYFSKPARDLSLAESAMLAAVPQYPLQNPIDNPAAAKLRQGLVLQAMVAQGNVTQAAAAAAAAEPLAVRPFGDRYDIIAPHFSTYARAETEAILNDLGLDGARLVTRGGLRVYTTIDVDLQLQAECVARSHLTRLAGGDPAAVFNTGAGTPCVAASYLPGLTPEVAGVAREVTNAAAVVLRAETGEILSMVGSVDYWNAGIQGNYNAALAQRQPASAFKPIVYTAAFLQGALPGYPHGITAATMTYDVQTQFSNDGQPYTPVNIDRLYHGPVSVRSALANSYNVPAVQMVNVIGLGPVIRTAHRLGINSLNQSDRYGLALALGSGEVSLLDLTYSYNVFNTGGYMVGMPVHKNESTPGFRTLNPVAVLRIEDSDGQVLWQYGHETGTYERRLILEPALAYIMTDILADNEARASAFGRDSAMELTRPAAVKTGTSNDNRDSWAVGYTPQIVSGVWVGNNDNRSMQDITGLSGAAPIWHALMEYLHTRDALPRQDWSRPATVVARLVCEISGLLPTRDCPQVRELFYVDQARGIDTQPMQPDTYWKRYAINVCNWRLANVSSPPECVDEQAFFDYPPEARAWARSTGQRLPPDEYDVVGAPATTNAATILSPSPLARVRDVVEVRGNVNAADVTEYRLDYGTGTLPDVWRQVGPGQSEAGRDIVMGTWDTRELSDGTVYTLRLTVVRADNALETSYVTVTVDNQPPQVTLTAPLPGAELRLGRDVSVVLEAAPDDNVQVSHVEFYVDRDLVATSEEWPFSARWRVGEEGTWDFWAVAYDAAGNSAESERARVTAVR